LGLAAPRVSALTLAIAAVIVVAAVAATDRQIVSHATRRVPRTSIAGRGTPGT